MFSVAKLFFAYGLGNGLLFPFCGRRDDDPVPRPARRRRTSTTSSRAIGRRCSSPCPPATPMLLADGRRAGADPDLSDIRLARLGGRGAAGGHLRALQSSASASRSWTASARPRSCTSSSPTEPARVRPGSSGCSCPATRPRSWTTTVDRCLRARSATCWSRATRPARCTGTSTSGPKTPSRATGSGPATNTIRTRTATSGTRADPTTCSRSAASG